MSEEREPVIVNWHGELTEEQLADIKRRFEGALRKPQPNRVVSAGVPSGPGLVCPGCGSRQVDFERGLLFCGTCAETTDMRGDDDD